MIGLLPGALNPFGGLNVRVVPSWVTGMAWRLCTPGRVPPKNKRKGTRKLWKRANPRGLRWRMGPVEPDHCLTKGNVVLCTQLQFEALKKASD